MWVIVGYRKRTDSVLFAMIMSQIFSFCLEKFTALLILVFSSTQKVKGHGYSVTKCAKNDILVIRLLNIFGWIFPKVLLLVNNGKQMELLVLVIEQSKVKV